MDSEQDFSTPWIRHQLLESLGLLADRDWVAATVAGNGQSSHDLDRVLDFLDDTGAVDEPANQAGAFLVADEVGRARHLGRVLDRALGTRDPEAWGEVAAAAHQLLIQMVAERS